jgi:hypothetical protein
LYSHFSTFLTFQESFEKEKDRYQELIQKAKSDEAFLSSSAVESLKNSHKIMEFIDKEKLLQWVKNEVSGYQSPFSFSIKDDLPKTISATHQLLALPITLELTALDDGDINTLIKKMNEACPGIFQMEEFTLKKFYTIDEETLQKVRDKQLDFIFKATIKGIWYYRSHTTE